MFCLPEAAEPLTQACSKVFTKPTFKRFVLLVSGLIVTCGRHTVSRSLRPIEPLLGGHWSNYHRLYSRARYSMWDLAAVLTRQVLKLLPADASLMLAADDTVDGKGGDHVWAKGAAPRRPAVDSQTRSGEVRAQVAGDVRAGEAPGMNRPWALPILRGMCHAPKEAAKLKCRKKTASQLSHQLMIRLMRWFPDRQFILLADARAASHRLACFAHRHADRVTLVSRIRSDANLYDPPERRNARKGSKQLSPREQLDRLAVQQAVVAWYGSSERKVKLVSNTGLWYLVHSRDVVPIRWVCVRGQDGLDDAYFYSSDSSLDPARIVQLYASRWNIEVTFQECRALLGLETTRHWCRQSVLRVTPMLLGLFTTVSLIWNELSKTPGHQARLSQTPCYRKQQMTFSDALYQVRLALWDQSLLQHHLHRRRYTNPEQMVDALRQALLPTLASAA